MQAVQLTLPGAGVFTIHCFFGYCSHVAESADCQEAHDLMEQHYTELHQREIDLICYRLTGQRPGNHQEEGGS